jgi:nicotinamidase/pyrazinamidase
MTQEAFPITIGVDIQNDFCPGGSLAVTDGDSIIPAFNKLAAATRAQNGRVIFTRDWHPAKTNHFDSWPVHCVANTDGAAFHPDLFVDSRDTILSKGTLVNQDAYSGFQGLDGESQDLAAIIMAEFERHERISLRIGGLATDYCVKATVLDALKLQRTVGLQKLSVLALRDCMKAVNIQSTDEAAAIAEMQAAGARFIDAAEAAR